MQFKVQVVIEDDDQASIVEDIIQLDKSHPSADFIGLSLADSKQLLKRLQQVMITRQADAYAQS